MSKLLNLKSKTGRKKKKRVGRGNGSGLGTYSARGMNGQNCRSGGKRRPGFEGGQTPLLMRLPKLKGFKAVNRIEYQVVNVGELNIFNDGDKVEVKNLIEKNLVSNKNKPVKLLGGKGDLEKQLTVVVHKASESAQKAIEAKKGNIEFLEKTNKA